MTGPPLQGVRVVELGAWVAGPAAGAVLADWGADVIKVEPVTGDPIRLSRRGSAPTAPTRRSSSTTGASARWP